MGLEINLLNRYPKTKRNTEARGTTKNNKNILIAKKFGKEFFDGERDCGYGGYYYQSKYWCNVVDDLIYYYNISKDSSILDVGCAKGFMLYEFKKKIPEIKIVGVDISSYAINNSKPEIKKYLRIGNAESLSFSDNSFDVVFSIVTLHNLKKRACAKAIKEIERVSKKNSFITVDAYSNKKEKNQMLKWNLTAETIMHKKEWLNFFKKNGYTGDYYWFIP